MWLQSSRRRRTAMAGSGWRLPSPPSPPSRFGCRGDSDRFSWNKPFRCVRGGGGERGCREAAVVLELQQRQQRCSCFQRHSSVKTNVDILGFTTLQLHFWVPVSNKRTFTDWYRTLPYLGNTNKPQGIILKCKMSRILFSRIHLSKKVDI